MSEVQSKLNSMTTTTRLWPPTWPRSPSTPSTRNWIWFPAKNLNLNSRQKFENLVLSLYARCMQVNKPNGWPVLGINIGGEYSELLTRSGDQCPMSITWVLGHVMGHLEHVRDAKWDTWDIWDGAHTAGWARGARRAGGYRPCPQPECEWKKRSINYLLHFCT